MNKNMGFESAEEASNWAFRQRTPKQRMDWLEDMWELQRIGLSRRRKLKRNDDKNK